MSLEGGREGRDGRGGGGGGGGESPQSFWRYFVLTFLLRDIR